MSSVQDYGKFSCNNTVCLAAPGDGQPMCVQYQYLHTDQNGASSWVQVQGCVGGYVVNSPGGTAYNNPPAMMTADALLASPQYRNIQILDVAVPVGFINGAAGVGPLRWLAAAAAVLALLAPGGLL